MKDYLRKDKEYNIKIGNGYNYGNKSYLIGVGPGGATYVNEPNAAERWYGRWYLQDVVL